MSSILMFDLLANFALISIENEDESTEREKKCNNHQIYQADKWTNDSRLQTRKSHGEQIKITQRDR